MESTVDRGVPFVDLRPQHEAIAPALRKAFESALAGSQFILGPDVGAFERAFAQAVGAAHAVGVSNGLDALTLSLAALDIGAGDEVLVPANTFAATALAVLAVGARPVLVDCDADHLIDLAAAQAAVSPRARAVIPVHLYGRPVGMTALMEWARKAGLAVIEDAAQAHGARHGNRACGAWGDAGAFSFYPTKNLGALGDGGLVTTDNADLAERVRRLGNYGQKSKYEHVEKGRNCRLDTLQAALLLAKLPRLAEWNRDRAAMADVYSRGLRGVGDLVLPRDVPPGDAHVWHLYVIQTGSRDALQEHLERLGIGTGIHYPLALHEEPAFSDLGYRRGQFPIAERLAGRILSLPLYPGIGRERVDRVCAAIRDFFAKRA